MQTCLVKVNLRSSWQRTVRKVLSKCQGVYNFRMNQEGEVEISGTVDPSLLLKMLGKAGSKAELRWLQFGECSSNLFMPITRRGYSGGTTYAPDGRYLHSSNLHRPKLPSHDSKSNYQIAYGHYPSVPDYHNYYNQQSYDKKQYYLPAYDHSHDYNQHGYDHSHNCNQHAYGLNQDYYQQHGYDHSQDHYQQHGYDLSHDAYGQRHVVDQNQYRPPMRATGGEDMGCCRMM